LGQIFARHRFGYNLTPIRHSLGLKIIALCDLWLRWGTSIAMPVDVRHGLTWGNHEGGNTKKGPLLIERFEWQYSNATGVHLEI